MFCMGTVLVTTGSGDVTAALVSADSVLLQEDGSIKAAERRRHIKILYIFFIYKLRSHTYAYYDYNIKKTFSQ